MFDFLLPPDNLRPVIILNDRGGRISDYEAMANRYTLEGREVRIIGFCWSACSLALSVPNVCVGSMATVMFHDAYDPKTGKVTPEATKVLVDRLPFKVKAAVSGKIKKNFSSEATFDAQALVKLGIRKCIKEIE